jgi:hypothetical protein
MPPPDSFVSFLKPDGVKTSPPPEAAGHAGITVRRWSREYAHPVRQPTTAA